METMETQEMKPIQITQEQAKFIEEACNEKIKIRDTMKRLLINPDFKLVFEEEYLKKESARLTLLLTEHTWTDEKDKKALRRENLMESLIGIAKFNNYIDQVFSLGNQAENQLNALREANTVEE